MGGAGDHQHYTYAVGAQIPGTPYRVEKHLGAGGMGVVYAARHSFLNRLEAVKTIHPELVDRADIAERMKHEAEVLSSLRHPNIVQVTGGGVSDDAWRLPYFAMEMLTGKTLRDVIRRGAIDVASVYAIAYEMLDALGEAHAAGIVHRDVKPENVFLHTDASRTAGPRVATKLLDFGVMAMLGGRQSRHFRGTFKYAAPEQMRGDPVSAQTDLYSVALVLYEMLAGRGPFDSIKDWRAMARAHLEQAPRPLSSLVAVPPALDALLLRALSKDPKDRPETAMSFAQQLFVLKELAEKKPMAHADATEVSLLTAIRPTDVGAPIPSRLVAAHLKEMDPNKTVEQALPFGEHGPTIEMTIASHIPPPPSSEPHVSIGEPDIDREDSTRTEDLLEGLGRRDDTDPIRASEHFSLPRPRQLSPRSPARVRDPERARERRVTESNVTPPPVSAAPIPARSSRPAPPELRPDTSTPRVARWPLWRGIAAGALAGAIVIACLAFRGRNDDRAIREEQPLTASADAPPAPTAPAPPAAFSAAPSPSSSLPAAPSSPPSRTRTRTTVQRAAAPKALSTPSRADDMAPLADPSAQGSPAPSGADTDLKPSIVR